MLDQVGKLDEPSHSGASRPVRLLTFTTLFPHRGRPNHGIFVENRLRHVVESREATSTVIAPVPWFPSRSPRFGDWSKHAQAERQEQRGDLIVYHPRFPLLPRVGMSSAPAALFVAGARELRRLSRLGLEIDLIDGHYVYPDGVAAVALGKAFNKPVVLTARGSDITQFPDYRLPRRMIRWAMQNADALISVSAGLRSAMITLGAQPEKVTVLRNGVDLHLFKPADPSISRQLWGIQGKILLSVGHLIERKRNHLTIEALVHLPDWTLVLIGDGPEKHRLKALAAQFGVTNRVIFDGPRPHAELANFYSAADISVLASSREGWANVLLESIACGTPVVASNIPGNPEVVTSLAAGLIVAENSASCFAQTIARLHDTRLPREKTRQYAEALGWDATTEGQLKVFRQVINAGSDSQKSST